MKPDSRIDLSLLHEGMNLHEYRKDVTQENVKLYAEASKDFNPIHIDEDFAKNTPLGGTIAHGMLILAYVSQMMTKNFGQLWLNCGKLSVKFKTPARPGDTMSITGSVKRIEATDSGKSIKCNIVCRNQSGETIISGEASIILNDIR